MDTPLFILTQLGFVVLTFLFYGIVLWYLKKALEKSTLTGSRQKSIYRNVVLALALWLTASSTLSLTGFLSEFDAFPPRMMIILLVPLLTLVWALLISKTTRELLPFISSNALVTIQVFRLFVEILLWMLFIQHLLPEQMTFEGRNFDIIAGITGPVVAYLAFSKKILPKKAVIVWNVICLCLLINIVTIAVLSILRPFATS